LKKRARISAHSQQVYHLFRKKNKDSNFSTIGDISACLNEDDSEKCAEKL
jgi:hypothetical protein